MQRIAIIGGTGYLASLIKYQENIDKNRYTFFSRKKNLKNYIKYLSDKNLNILKDFDHIIHLAGPNKDKLDKSKSLIQKKNQLTSRICDLCLTYNIKLIYISSLQVYKNYGKNELSINSKINLKNLYSKSHYESEKIILKKFSNHKKNFIILRMGNVFGFKKLINLKKINDNLIHNLCITAFKKKKFLIKNGSIQRTFIPSQIFIQIINFIIRKDFFSNSIENIFYKNLSLKEIAEIIQKRFKALFDSTIEVKINNFKNKKNFNIYPNHNFNFNPNNKKISCEIDQILKCIKKQY